ncbi:aspartate aminotransferase family protein [Phototrophicus methaneseepsis]|uniref:Acetylornithine aminotransferase n=1 Tax=Phototrophicus methaneseepsis TaxID=2710758 RepID=A0A7S8E5G0_9CHLR|nr:aspartate aminotransferase family protein [Phototrophicus methaneseepsis]QPC80707.1 aspartate aminotransferase family protein [Phototrophicus methaneseepsis]
MSENTDAQAVIQAEHDYLVQTYVRPDFVLQHGDGMTLYDDAGNAYTDWVAGIAVNALGYNDAGIAAAMQQQTATGIIHTSNLYFTEPQVRLAKALVEKSFADRVFFSNSGAEANEGALKFARRVAYDSGNANKVEVVTFSEAFHGRTLAALSLTPKEKYQKPYKPLMDHVVVAEFNNIESAKGAINANTAAVILEPIQGEGGINVATDAFLQVVRDLCDEHQAILIFDEIQCGMGRSGTLWAYEQTPVVPDIMTLAKPLAGGLPIGAILCTEEIASHLKPGDHGSTFAGGPLVTNVASYILERISQPQFLAHIKEVGDYLLERLEELNSPLIVDVRGRGLMCAMELKVEVAPVIKAGYENGLLMVNAGTNTIRFVPPLIAEKSDVDELVEKVTAILEVVHA